MGEAGWETLRPKIVKFAEAFYGNILLRPVIVTFQDFFLELYDLVEYSVMIG